MGLNKKDLALCKQKLVEEKQTVLNQIQKFKNSVKNRSSRSGDEADQTQEVIEEKQDIEMMERGRFKLVEIEHALSRIEKGSYGICEETGEKIEKERLFAYPWTRLSIEGAEFRELDRKKKQA